MKKLNLNDVQQVTGAGVPMPVPKLNGPSVDSKTSQFFKDNGKAIAAGMSGAAIGTAAGMLGGPVGSVIGGGIGAVVGSIIKG